MSKLVQNKEQAIQTANRLTHIQAEKQVLDAQLQLDWTKLKLTLTNHLLEATPQLSLPQDYNQAYNCIRSIQSLSKLIGEDVPPPVNPEEIDKQHRYNSALVDRFSKPKKGRKTCNKSASGNPSKGNNAVSP